MNRKTKILIVLGIYLPGYKGGGPIRSIANLIELLGDEFQFRIATSDRDLGDNAPYPDVLRDAWQKKGKVEVIYLSPKRRTFLAWRHFLRGTVYDLIYLSSFFSRLSIWTLLLSRLKLIPPVPIIMAPCGEFSKGALALKAYKKRCYMALANMMALDRGVVWHASTEYEALDIRRLMGKEPRVVTAADPAMSVASDPFAELNAAENPTRFKTPGELRMVFLSRISRKKNLDFGLRLLYGVTGRLHFDIYGPQEDKGYWRECERLIGGLPPHVLVQYRGTVTPDHVFRVFSAYHLFLFPTRGENFGHVILEALCAGCPVLVSDQTPWRHLESKGIGWDVALSEPDIYRALLNRCVAMNDTEFASTSLRAKQYAVEFIKRQVRELAKAYRALFFEATSG